MLEAFERHCPMMQDRIVRNWTLFNELVKVSNEALVRNAGTKSFAVSDGWYPRTGNFEGNKTFPQ